MAVSPGRAVPNIPSAPASDTAAASSGGAAAPMPACWIGTAQPTSCVNLVAIIVASRVVDLVALTVARMRRRGYLDRRSLLSWVKQPGRRLHWHKARRRRTTLPYFASKRLFHRIAALRSASGRTRSFGDVRVMSAFHPIATKSPTSRHFGFGPEAEVIVSVRLAMGSKSRAFHMIPEKRAVSDEAARVFHIERMD
jgi:hypothetical protein